MPKHFTWEYFNSTEEKTGDIHWGYRRKKGMQVKERGWVSGVIGIGGSVWPRACSLGKTNQKESHSMTLCWKYFDLSFSWSLTSKMRLDSTVCLAWYFEQEQFLNKHEEQKIILNTCIGNVKGGFWSEGYILGSVPKWLLPKRKVGSGEKICNLLGKRRNLGEDFVFSNNVNDRVVINTPRLGQLSNFPVHWTQNLPCSVCFKAS